MNKIKTLNDEAWEFLFQKYNILDKINESGIYVITSKEINEFREARLMTKFDHKSNLPILFRDNNLSILPITRGNYIIGNFEAYHKFEKISDDIQIVNAPSSIHSIDFENITSEATAISVAYLSGILGDFLKEESLMPTVSGRMGSDVFDFDILNQKTRTKQNITVMNSQLEIDGGYECFNSLMLMEAKNSISNDFLIRQMYYPYRLFKKRVRKPVKSVYLTYSNGVFNLYEYDFAIENDYNSLVLINQKNYSLDHEKISYDEIISIFKNVKYTKESEEIPFPQANSFNRIINLCELLNENEYLTSDEITYNYDFDARQTNYYTDACRYLGLVNKRRDSIDGVVYYLTEKGKSLFKINLKNRNLAFVRAILEKRAFYKVFGLYLEKNKMPDQEEIIKIMQESNLYNIRAISTYIRRTTTITGWIKWILELPNNV